MTDIQVHTEPMKEEPLTLAQRVTETEVQIHNHLEAIARVGERMTAAEKAITALLREVGAA